MDATGLEITVEGDTVKVEGAAVSQEMKEKVILDVGNIEGVASKPMSSHPDKIYPGQVLRILA